MYFLVGAKIMDSLLKYKAMGIPKNMYYEKPHQMTIHCFGIGKARTLYRDL